MLVHMYDVWCVYDNVLCYVRVFAGVTCDPPKLLCWCSVICCDVTVTTWLPQSVWVHTEYRKEGGGARG